MPIVATAGHVDHGKSTLVQALTGTDPDRWAEEKARGLTIDLGFAWTEIGDHDVGFVDVPGHERFIKNMLAGMGAIDCAMLVVAADSGWMPQTEEHASVLDLLEVDRGVIALTRVDLVDADTVDIATLEVMDEIEGTHLEDWPVVAVSGVTGTGLDELRDAIASRLDVAPRGDSDPFRMWVDRSFTVAGAGQVVTGTTLDGHVAVGDELVVEPDGAGATVRSLQHHGAAVDAAGPGNRLAINVAGQRLTVGRGDLLADPGTADSTQRFLAALDPARAVGAIPDRGAFHLHIGTLSVPAGLRRLHDAPFFVITVDHPVPAIIGDRVIVRDAGRRSVVGGGRILDTHPSARPSLDTIELLAAAVGEDRGRRADALVAVHRSIDAGAVRRATGGGTPSEAVVAGPKYLHPVEVERLTSRITDEALAYHQAHPTRPGVPNSALASTLGIDGAVVDAVVRRSDDLTILDGAVRAGGFSNTLTPDQEEGWARVCTDLEESFNVPRMGSIELDPETLHFLLRSGDLVKIADDLVFTAGQASEIIERVAELPDGFTVADFRDHFEMSRRQAVPTLEWLDSTGRTRRSGDGRSVRAQRPRSVGPGEAEEDS